MSLDSRCNPKIASSSLAGSIVFDFRCHSSSAPSRLHTDTYFLSRSGLSFMQRSLLHSSRACGHGLSRMRGLSPQFPTLLTQCRRLSTSPSEPTPTPEVVYQGPLTNTFRRLKIFSLSSLALSVGLAPFIFVIEASGIPLGARFALAGVAMTTSGVSTGLVTWCGSPYVTKLQRVEKDHALQMTTLTLGLRERITSVYDTSFLKEASRAFAKWELADHVKLDGKEQRERAVAGTQETVAETTDAKGRLVGSWVVTWGENGEGTCKQVGKVHRYAYFWPCNRAELTGALLAIDISTFTKSSFRRTSGSPIPNFLFLPHPRRYNGP